MPLISVTLVAAGVAIDVMQRSKRRLFGLAGLAPLAGVVRPSQRPKPSVGAPGRSNGTIRYLAVITCAGNAG
jgi:hypothetical protein